MRAKPDADGSLMFCWSKRGKVRKYNKASPEYAAWEGCSMCGKKPCTNCNGRSLSVSEWKTAFSTLSQKQKKAQLEANLNKTAKKKKNKLSKTKKAPANKKDPPTKRAPTAAKSKKMAAPKSKSRK
jgi:hypothetical protein